jgi:hypothetical protein
MFAIAKKIKNKFIYRTEIEPGETLPLIVKEDKPLISYQLFVKLPTDLQTYIFSFLNVKDIGAIRLANKDMQKLIETSNLKFTYHDSKYNLQTCSLQQVYAFLRERRQNQQQLKNTKSQARRHQIPSIALLISGLFETAGSLPTGFAVSAGLASCGVSEVGFFSAACGGGFAAGACLAGVGITSIAIGIKRGEIDRDKIINAQAQSKKIKAHKPEIQMMRM